MFTKRKLIEHCLPHFLLNQDVKVPVENLIGEQDNGFKLIMSNFAHERLMISYVAHRLARVCIEDAMNYASKRKVFGKRLIDSEVIRNKVSLFPSSLMLLQN